MFTLLILSVFSITAANTTDMSIDSNYTNINNETSITTQYNNYELNTLTNENLENENIDTQSITYQVDNSKDGDTITLNPKEYNETGIVINHNLTIIGNGTPDKIIINGNNKSGSIFTISPNITVTFINFTFLNGNNIADDGTGGAIDNYANLKVYNCIFINNSAYIGGAIASESGTVYVNNSIFKNNYAAYDGGAIKSERRAQILIENSKFSNNTSERDGGAVGFTIFSNSTLNNCIFEYNSGSWGGAIYNWASFMNINNCTIKNNNANKTKSAGGKGGAIMTSGPLNITNSIIINNNALKYGGAIAITFEDEETIPIVNIENNSIYDNFAPKGENVWIGEDPAGMLKLQDSSINNNWWGINDPLTKTNWYKYFMDTTNTIKVPETWINIITTIDNDTKIIEVESYIYNSTDNKSIKTEKFDGLSVYFNQQNITSYLKNGETQTKFDELLFNETITTVNNEKYPYIKEKTYLDINYLNDKIIFNLTDENGSPISNATLNYIINNTKASVITDKNGIAQINGRTGKYTVNVSYDGNEIYSSANASMLLTTNKVNDISTTIIYKNMTQKAVDFYDGERGGYFNTVLKDQDGNVLVNKPVNIGFNGVVYNLVTDENGVARLQINLAYAGDYTFAICFLSDDEYKGAFEVAKITILKRDITTKIIASNLVKVYGNNGRFTATITNGSNYPLANKKLNFIVNSKTYTATTNNNNGQASIAINLKPGKYTILIKFNGNDIFKGSSLSRTITININSKKATTINADDYVKTYGEAGSFIARLVNTNNNPIKNQKIDLVINKKVYTKITNSNGQVSLPINLIPGLYTINIIYKGNSQYSAVNINKYILVKKPIIISSNMNNNQIQDTLNNLNSKETVIFSKGNYNNINLTIPKPLTITGESSTINGVYNTSVFTINANDVTIKGFEIITNNSTAIILNGNNAKINNNTITSILSGDIPSYYNGTTEFIVMVY
ncbi:carboxypeptidase-like regulatory domain-containing protein [Methanobrevibacter sp. 87.7]|uniref:Ig-like domain repeat protein n=1 Tax=Methanobrevibacter sp. 87.7 TaxID=387957 RepID=UPI00117E9771|nr:carboxypeptidase-like regulatory domain-containing protein [Methanobrevibacter sp. 87.7]